MRTRVASVVVGLVAVAGAGLVEAGTPACSCAGDATGDGLIDVQDLVSVISMWGACLPPCPPSCPADFDDSCTVDVQDLVVVISGWGACPPQIEEPGPSIPLAFDLGPLEDGPIELCEHIGHFDTDVYAFQIDEVREVVVTLTERVDGIRAWIIADINDDGVIDATDELEFNESGGAGDVVVVSDLVPGSYYIKVSPESSGAFTAYTMRVTASVLPALPADPGASLPEAHELGVVRDDTIAVQDIVGGFDPLDVFVFTLAEAREVIINVGGRTEGVDAWLVADVNGDDEYQGVEQLAFDDDCCAGLVTLVEDLVPGSYYVRLGPNASSDTTRYTLTLTSQTLPMLPSDPDDSMAGAHDLGTVGGGTVTVQDVVGGFDTGDVFVFTLAEAREVVINIGGRTEGIDARLIADLNGDDQYQGVEQLAFDDDCCEGLVTLVEDLAPGSYFVWIDPNAASDSTRYTLDLVSSTLPMLPADPGDSMAGAHDLGTVGDATITVQDIVGGFDTGDVFVFTLVEAREVVINIGGRTEGVDALLIADVNGDDQYQGVEQLAFDDDCCAGLVTLVEDLAPGSYFVWIDPNAASDSTRYTLDLLSSTLPITPRTDPGDNLDEAYDAGELGDRPVEVHDIVGGYDPIDVYAFTITEPRTVVATVLDRTEGVDVWLIDDLNGNLAYDGGSELVDFDDDCCAGIVTVSGDLPPGTYYVWIDPNSSSDSTRYTLRLTSQVIP